MRRTYILAIAGLGFLSFASAGGAQQKEPFPGFDAYVRAALTTWKVPGAAVAIVRNDSVIYARGYGLREIGKPDAVDERTLFAIGSSSKAFTAAAVAMLVDSGKVSLDARATAYLPGFQLYDTFDDLLVDLAGPATFRRVPDAPARPAAIGSGSTPR